MKKIGQLLVAVALICTALVGCGKTDQPQLDTKNPVTVTLWHYYNGAQKSAFDQLVAEFNGSVGLEEGIVIEASNQGSVNQLIENVLASAADKVGTQPVPNLFTGYADTVYQIDQMGLVAGLDAFFTPEELAAYIPDYIKEGYLGEGGELKILPTAKSTEVFVMNKTDWDKFANATGADIGELASYEGIAKTAKAYYEWTDALTPEISNDGKAFYGRDAMANYFIIGSRQLGQEIFSVKDGVVSFELEEETLRRLWDNYYVPFISGYFAANGKFRSDDAKVGDLIAQVGSSSSTSYFPTQVIVDDQEAYSIESIVLTPPIFKGGSKVAVQQGAGLAMTKSTPELMYGASIFMKWFTQAQRNAEFSVSSGYLPVLTEASNIDQLGKAMEAQEQPDKRDFAWQSLSVATETTQTYELYTNPAFFNGTAARSVLEAALSDIAKEGRTQVVALLEAGVSLEEAVAQVNTDARFSTWLAQLKQDLENTQKGK